ncbi:MAG: dNTP triphosphohydrolase, partial [Bacteroidales bacterium]|nr:dNTP triphosphohydrolase [Bacteroidales bacterium]
MKERWNEILNPSTFRNWSKRTEYDGRNPFENDYGRLISSSSIRRLQDKTQVFPLEKSDFIRTRLTHSLEVSYIGSSIGLSIEKHLIDNKLLDNKFKGHISSLLRVSGLVHDLGNPPFGHFGEEAIQHFFKEFFIKNNRIPLTDQEKADFANFDGNVQTFRILRKLHYFGDEFSFNLTFPSLASIIKYPSNSLEGNLGNKSAEISKKKFGYFCSEQKDYEKINNLLKLNNRRHPIVYLLEAADDIAYCAADIEDGVKLGLLTFDDIRKVFSANLKQNIDLLNTLENLYKEIIINSNDKISVVIQKFRVIAQSIMIGEVIESFKENYDSIITGTLEKEIIYTSKASDIRKAFKQLQYIVFDSKKIMQAELAGWESIYGLLEIFINGILSEDFVTDKSNKESRL